MEFEKEFGRALNGGALGRLLAIDRALYLTSIFAYATLPLWIVAYALGIYATTTTTTTDGPPREMKVCLGVLLVQGIASWIGICAALRQIPAPSLSLRSNHPRVTRWAPLLFNCLLGMLYHVFFGRVAKKTDPVFRSSLTGEANPSAVFMFLSGLSAISAFVFLLKRAFPILTRRTLFDELRIRMR